MSKKTSTRRPLPAGFQVTAGRIVASASAPIPRLPRAEDMPEEKKDPDAAEPKKCEKCGAEVPPDAKFCPECGAELPAESGNEEAPPEPPAKEAAAFARHALSVTRAKSLEAARGTIAAWKEAAGRTSALSAELGEKSARLATIERERLLERAVAEGRLDPSEAWSFSADEKGGKLRGFSEWAGPVNPAKGTGQSLEQLAAFIAQRPAASSASAPSRAFTPAGKATSTPAAAPPGMNPDFYAAASRQVAEQLG